MSSSPDHFEELRQLLALKRHEQPPPGYFTHFSDKVIARIEAEGLAARGSWWQSLFVNVEAKPVLACVYGVIVGGLLIGGMSISRTVESEENGAPLETPRFAAVPPPVWIITPVTPAEPAAQPLGTQSELSSSVTPVLSSGSAGPFFDLPRTRVEKLSYTLP